MSLPTHRYVKKYTVKEWKGFRLEIQEQLTKRYTVILTDYKTKKEKRKEFFSKFSVENLNKGIDKFQRIMHKVDKGFKEFDKMKGQSLFNGITQKEYNEMFGGMGKKDYSNLLGKKTRRDYSALIGKKFISF